MAPKAARRSRRQDHVKNVRTGAKVFGFDRATTRRAVRIAKKRYKT